MCLLRNNVKVIPAHKVYNTTAGKVYEVVDKYRKSVAIIDDLGNKVWITRTCKQKYFSR